ncbi:OmpA family protein [Adhaeribacter radiodurans]|uniref:OmpA family protein n=1 Tax=Adhaeribacter radiodurans TaxID=2745197 RepID=A0A7L7L4X7_9BACT|nr:OmpA family protein [Adhaeribacter radiodurans]QMU27857.1 OmpA family protein [Adhaeribacter radiodurans]
MKILLFLLMSSFICFGANAQHNLYYWQVKGYTGLANFYNPNKKGVAYIEPDDNSWYRLEIGRSLGKTLGISAGASFGKIKGLAPQGNSFLTKTQMSTVKLYFYTDNGWLLNPEALISPFFFAGYGISTINQQTNPFLNENSYQQVLPFGLGFKIRLAERWQLDLQAEAIYNVKSFVNEIPAQQNKYNNAFVHTGISLAYNFGFKPSTFKAPRFYANVADTLSLRHSVQAKSAIQPTTNQFTDTIPEQVAPISQKLAKRSTSLETPEKQTVTPRMVIIRDTVVVTDNTNRLTANDSINRQRIIQQNPDTLYVTSKANVNSQNKLADKISEKDKSERNSAHERAIRNREKALEDYDLRTKRATVLRRNQPTPVQKPARTTLPYQQEEPNVTTRQVYPPTNSVYENSRRPTNPVGTNAVVLLVKDRKNLEEANRNNRELRFAFDSLNTVMNQDTALAAQLKRQNTFYDSLDKKVMRYMQDQANLNDSLQQRFVSLQKQLSSAPPTTNVPLEPKPGEENNYNTNVFFTLNSSTIPSQSYNSLLACTAFLKNNPEQKLQLTGYADRTGSASYNLLLSRKRVEAVANFFQLQGIEKERIFIQYFGETNESLQPLGRKVVVRMLN